MNALLWVIAPLGGACYLGTGLKLLSSIGRPGSGLEWDEPPTFFRRAVVVTCWPAIKLTMRLG